MSLYSRPGRAQPPTGRRPRSGCTPLRASAFAIRQKKGPTLLLLLLLVLAAVGTAQAETLDDFGDPAAWQVLPSDGLAASLSASGDGALRLDYDFRGHGGYVVLRRQVALELPERWAFDLRLRGEGPRNNFEFKLLDPSLENVWWVNRRGYALPADWADLRTRSSRFEFAWGPLGGGVPKRIVAIEFAISAGEGGHGHVDFDRLDFTVLPLASPTPPALQATAASAAPGFPASRALDGDPTTAWKPAAAGPSSFEIDLGEPRELGGLLLRWPDGSSGGSGPRAYTVSGSLDGHGWQVLRRFERAAGGADAVTAPELELRYLRCEFPQGAGLELREIEILPPRFGEDRNALITRLAALGRRGDFPRAYSGATAFWTVAGEDGGEGEALLNEDGALEPWRGAFSLEPFLETEKGLLSWAEAESTPRLAPGGLPIPAVRLAFPGGLHLDVATASSPGALYLRYRLENGGPGPAKLGLVLALRPFQVDPPWQFLSQQGGVTPVRRLALTPETAAVEGREVLRLAPAAVAIGAQIFEEGSLLARLRAGQPPVAATADDAADGLASGYFRFSFEIPPGESREVVAALPWPGQDPPPRPLDFAARETESLAFWRARLGAVALEVPPAAGELGAAVKSALGHILIHRDGAGIQPGSRSYERSWIRDGALTSSALLRFGLDDVARDFLKWFAPYQFDNGKVPCCVDRRGSDPVPENDSGGQLLYLAHEVWRFGHDEALLRELWPRLAKAVDYLDQLRRQRRGPEWQRADRKVFYGLLPESISHEGYSAKPMHSYWDDFWAERGLADAVELAQALGHQQEATAWTAIHDEFAADLLASLELAMREKGIDYLPGCAELGDFDATSTAIALAPGRLGARLPQAALRRTFERYFDEVSARFEGRKAWDAYTAYELRNVGALLRLGEREKAWRLLAWLLADRRPVAWGQFPEVTFHEARAPRFNGDLPHGWVASELLRAVADFFAYENADGDLEIAAGLPRSWIDGPGAGSVRVRGLVTPWGRLELEAVPSGGGMTLRVSGLALPPGRRIFLHSPWGERREALRLPAEADFVRH